MTRILAIDTSSAWCSVALSMDDHPPIHRHQKLAAGASQLLLPWIEEVLHAHRISLSELDAIAIGVGPGAFTGVRLGVAVVQGLAIAAKLPVLAVASVDAIAAQVAQTKAYQDSQSRSMLIAIDARMGEVYWAKYTSASGTIPQREGTIELTAPEGVNLDGVQYIAGSALTEFGDRLLSSSGSAFPVTHQDPIVGIDSLGILACAQDMWAKGLQQDVHLLEPLYIRNQVALTTAERNRQYAQQG